MSIRVYEIAREQSLESKEVIQRLREAGVDVKSHSSSVEENVYERVFGDGETPNGRSAAQEAEAQEASPQKKRRRVVIDASARNRGARPAAPPAPAPREPERSPSPEEEAESGG